MRVKVFTSTITLKRHRIEYPGGVTSTVDTVSSGCEQREVYFDSPATSVPLLPAPALALEAA